ncbi:hypothetical protein ACLOJK_026229 [Asimina triloba]
MDESPPSAPPPSRPQRGSGIHINEGGNPSPQFAPPAARTHTPARARACTISQISKRIGESPSRTLNFRHSSEEDEFLEMFSHWDEGLSQAPLTGVDVQMGRDGNDGQQAGLHDGSVFEEEPNLPPFHYVETSHHQTPTVNTFLSSNLAKNSNNGLSWIYTNNCHIIFIPAVHFSSANSICNRIGNIENRLALRDTQFHEFKNETTAALNNTQERVNTVSSTIVTVAPMLRESFSTMMQQLDFTTGNLCEDNRALSATMRDLRDNTDKICLTAGLPSFNSLLEELAENNRRRVADLPPLSPKKKPPPGKEPYEFKYSLYFNRTRPFRSRQVKTTKGQSSNTNKSKNPVDISDDDEDDFLFPAEEQDPYEYRPEE